MGAKKIGTGWYEYKGYSITYLPKEETGYGRGHWIVGDDCATQTKRQALILIDQLVKKGIAPNT